MSIFKRISYNPNIGNRFMQYTGCVYYLKIYDHCKYDYLSDYTFDKPQTKRRFSSYIQEKRDLKFYDTISLFDNYLIIMKGKFKYKMFSELANYCMTKKGGI